MRKILFPFGYIFVKRNPDVTLSKLSNIRGKEKYYLPNKHFLLHITITLMHMFK